MLSDFAAGLRRSSKRPTTGCGAVGSRDPNNSTPWLFTSLSRNKINEHPIRQAIDLMTFDHGETEILAASEKASKKKCEQIVDKNQREKKKATMHRDPGFAISAS